MRGKKIALPQHFTPRSFSFKREPLHKKHPLVEPVFQITTRHVRVLPRRDIKDPLSNRHHHFPPLSRYLLCKCLDQNPYSLALRMTRDSDEIWTDRRFEKRRLAGRLVDLYHLRSSEDSIELDDRFQNFSEIEISIILILDIGIFRRISSLNKTQFSKLLKWMEWNESFESLLKIAKKLSSMENF